MFLNLIYILQYNVPVFSAKPKKNAMQKLEIIIYGKDYFLTLFLLMKTKYHKF